MTAEADHKTVSAEQLPLELGHGQSRGRDDLLVSNAIVPALDLIDRWPQWPSPVVVLVGPAGSGKSHLSGVWCEFSRARDIRREVCSGASMEGDDPAFLFEDADRTDFNETALFHLINFVRQHHRNLLITARTLPAQWNVALPDLRSRLAAATIVEIGAPDDALLEQVIFKLFSDRQLDVDDKVVRFIVTRMERSLDAARHIVDEIDRLSLSRGRRITRALAAEVVNAGDRKGGA